jgi:amidophosphoribosyltransferase
MSGVFGVISKSDCVEDLFYGTDYQSHLGTEFAGMAIQGDGIQRRIHKIARGQFKNLFDSFRRNAAGPMGVGVISDSQPQPVVIGSRFGTFAVVSAGLITNAEELGREMIQEGVTFSEILDGQINRTELVAKMIARGRSIADGIQGVFEKIRGSLSLLVMAKEGIYAACDRGARLPLAVGEREGTTAVASESCAFPNLGFEVRKYVQAGEIVLLDQAGMKVAQGSDGAKKICAFLWIYTGYPASSYEGVAVETVRERCGQALARKDAIEADLAAGIPDSGSGHAVGYAMASGLPFRRPLVKYSAGYGRSYTPPSQDVRDHIAKMKLIPVVDVIKGNRLVICEDSIVRGTQLKNQTIHKLWDAGAREVHVRVACPPLMFPCRYSLSTRTTGELAARRAIRALGGGDAEDVAPYLDAGSERYRAMVDWIRKEINCTSLIYLSLDEMVEAIGLPRSDLCTYCWTGD